MRRDYIVRAWTEEELSCVKEFYFLPHGRALVREKLPHRSEGAIDKIANRLGLKSFRISLRQSLTAEMLLSNTRFDPKTGCKVWMGSGPRGYAGIMIGREKWYVHRLIWTILYPSQDISELKVLHKCDNPPCINPKHLYAGTQADNIRDIWVRLRRIPKLKASDIPVIRKRLKAGETLMKLAEDYDVAFTTIFAIKSGRTWAHVK